MGDGNWFRKGRQRSKGSKRGRTSSHGKKTASSRTRHSSLSLEQLEDRRMLVTYLVTNLQDVVNNATVFGSLRWAVGQANSDDAADEIVFADSAFVDGFQNILSLNGGQLTITQPLSILGPGSRKLTISQSQNNRRIFETNIGAADDYFAVEISGVTLSGGNLNGTEARGGAIYNRENLTMVETQIMGNSAAGGGGVFTEFGALNLDRSLVRNNVGGIGGGIMNGSDADDNFPITTITNSTITGNSAVGIPGDDGYLPYGGGVFNRNGRLTITSSTIVGNNAIGGAGAGVASWGNEPPDPMSTDPPPAQTVFTFVGSSILFENLANPAAMPPMSMFDDIAVVGMTDDDPPLPLLPSVFGNDVDPMTGRRLEGTLGYNIIHSPGDQVVLAMTDQPMGTDPGFIVDGFGAPLLADYGGSTNVFMLEVGSPALDAADPLIGPAGYEQRGFRYTRVYDYGGGPIADVGAVERQAVTFVVDELFDEPEGEGQTAGVYQIVDINLGLITVLGYESPGDFTLREAIAFARKNVEPSVVTFADALRNREFENDPDAQVTPATLTLTLGQLTLSTDTVLIGPTSYILEIDASGNDMTPLSNDGMGTRVLQVGAGVDVTISNLTFMGGDINNVQGGAGILSYGDLTLIDSTIKDNYAAGSGSGVAIRGGTFTVSGTTFNNNLATINGGALFADGTSTVFVANSTFSGNTASGRGGAIANGNADLTIQSSTITLNTATTTRGSGVWTLNGAGATTTIGGSIISQNSVNDVEYATGADTKITSNGYNLVGTGNAIGRFNKIGDLTNVTNPMLEPLMLTGGQTATHRPKTGSPVIDVGDPNFDPNAFSPPLQEPLNFDQRGADFARVFDGDGVNGGRIDIGAYELQSAEFVVSTDLDGADGNYSFGFLSLREAIKLANDNPLPDRIIFDATLVAQAPEFSMNASSLTIDESADMRIRTSMIIEGPGSGLLTLNGSGLFHPLLPLQGPRRFFTIDDANSGTLIDVEIRGLSLIDATSGEAGGAISSRENLTLNDMVLINNHTVTYDPLLTGTLATGLHGGAIYQEGGSLTINESTLTGNYTNAPNSDGGGVFAINSTVNFFYNTLSGNTTLQGSSRGGGMAIKNSTLSASELSIIGNATGAGLSDGGGAYIEASNVVFEETAFGGNLTAGSNAEGGALYIAGASQVALEKNTTVSLNRTLGTQSSGGGVYVAGGLLTINNSALIQNSTSGATASGGGAAVGAGGALSLSAAQVVDNTVSGNGSNGGGLANLSGNLTVRDSLISGNRALNNLSKGGGLFSDANLAGSQATTILNSTVSGNVANYRGGGVFNADGLLEIKHATITNNSTPFLNAGNGVASWGNVATLTRVESSIVAGNAGSAAGTGSDIDFVDAQFVNSFQSSGYNVVGTGNALSKFNQPGDKVGITNPLLGPLAANGGPTQTHALLDGSPAINAGKPSFNANSFSPPLTTDERGVGFPRVLGGRIDAGAFESSFTPFSADFDLDGDVDGSDFLVWQRFNGLMAGGTKNKGDANSDGKVNSADLTIWRSQVGAGSSGAAAPASEGNSTPAVAAAVVAAPEDKTSAPATVQASSPLTFVTASAATALETTSIDVSDSSPSSPNYASIASGGIPSIGSTRRLAYRPDTARGSAHDVVHASHESPLSRRLAAAVASEGFESRFGGDASSEAREGDADAEDSVFAMLGDGTL